MSINKTLYSNKEYSSSHPRTLAAFRNRRCALPFADPCYQPPEPEEVAALIELAGWTQRQTALIVGCQYNPKKGSTTIRKWRTSKDAPEHREIPYSAWRLLLEYAGVVTVDDGLRALDTLR